MGKHQLKIKCRNEPYIIQVTKYHPIQSRSLHNTLFKEQFPKDLNSKIRKAYYINIRYPQTIGLLSVSVSNNP